jgi:uncharacterized protein (DUF111 family)
VMARELGTLGIRCIPMIHRFIATRSIEPVTVTLKGRECAVEVKCGWSNGEITSLKAEYDQAAACARELGIPLREVTEVVEAAAWQMIRQRGSESHE